jgi:hypothetical protein
MLFDRLVLAGLTFVKVSDAGALLERGPIDLAASGVPYWLSFEADAVLEPGPHGDHLEHVPDARKCRRQEGPRLDTKALPELTADEQRQVAEIWAELKAEKEPVARAIKLARGDRDIARLVQVGMPKPDAERIVLARAELGRLPLDDEYWFDETLPSGRGNATGWELLESAADWFAGGKTRNGSDPLEPDYPNVGSGVVVAHKAWWKANTHSQQAGLFVKSHAHGGQKFILAYDAADIVVLLDEMQAQGASAIVRLARLKTVYRQAYLPVDQAVAEQILRQARLPLPVVLEFGDPNEPDDAPGLGELARERLIAAVTVAVKDGKWDALVKLLVFGVFLTDALTELQAEDEIIGLGPFTVDWEKLHKRLQAEAKAVKKKAAAAAVAAGSSGLPSIPDPRRGDAHRGGQGGGRAGFVEVLAAGVAAGR